MSHLIVNRPPEGGAHASLATGWCRDATGALRRETIPSMLRRLVGWDYRQRAIYQITLTLADRASQALGRLEVKGPEGVWRLLAAAQGRAGSPDEIAARVVASEAGVAVMAALDEMPRRYPQVEIIQRQLMPDHLHFIVFVKAPIEKPLGALIRGFKAGASRRWKENAGENARAQHMGSLENARAQARHAGENARAQHMGSLENARAQARHAGENARAQHTGSLENACRGGGGAVPANSFAGLAGIPAWSEGYQDTILFRDGQLANMKRYLADNPRRLAVKRLFPDLFRVAGELAVPLAQAGLGRFAALGNRFLLARPLAQVQVSRREFGYRRITKPGGGVKIARDAQGVPIVGFDTPAFAEKKAALFAAAHHGTVLISPCISDGEREIARLALAAGVPLVTMHNKGFSKLQKPGGRSFDACAEGRLLMLAPAAWPFRPGEKAMTRFDATAMNRLCQWLAGEGAADINYHGLQPGNIDALALAAARVARPITPSA